MVSDGFQRDAVQYASTVHDSGRVVLCSARDNPELHGLLGAFGEKTGTPALLNAGLHEPDQPLAASPADALLIFMRTEMDTVVTNQTLARKVWS